MSLTYFLVLWFFLAEIGQFREKSYAASLCMHYKVKILLKRNCNVWTCNDCRNVSSCSWNSLRSSGIWKYCGNASSKSCKRKNRNYQSRKRLNVSVSLSFLIFEYWLNYYVYTLSWDYVQTKFAQILYLIAIFYTVKSIYTVSRNETSNSPRKTWKHRGTLRWRYLSFRYDVFAFHHIFTCFFLLE